jgi:crotonobetainyl-CoA:carnitine CoA-transferase CaiB-like acyl-CoA transferase
VSTLVDPELTPLDDIHVLEIAQGVVGPFCSMHLAAFGAHVTKVEPPWGDWLRDIPPLNGRTSALFEALNRNKRGLRLDLRTTTARHKLKNMISRSDVVLMDQATTKRWPSLSYESSSAGNGRLIWAEPLAYSDLESEANLKASELTIQMATGVNRHLGRPVDGAIRSSFDIASLSTSMFVFSGVMAALREREVSGLGQRVAVSMLAAMTAMLEWNLVSEGDPDDWIGVQLESYTAPPALGFILKDRVAYVEFRGDIAGWKQFLIGVGRADLADDPRFDQRQAMIPDMTDLKGQLASTMLEWKYEDLYRLVAGLGGTIAPIVPGDEAVASAVGSGLFDGSAGDLIDQISRPWSFSVGQLRASRSYEEIDVP